jgi:hypothetical protein
MRLQRTQILFFDRSPKKSFIFGGSKELKGIGEDKKQGDIKWALFL